MTTTTMATAALLAVAAVPATADDTPGWLTVPEALRGVVEVDARTGDAGGQFYVLQMDAADGGCTGQGRLQPGQWATQHITVTEPAELASLATGEPVTVEPGVYQARLCDPDYDEWGTVWVAGDEPVDLDDELAWYWTLPETAVEALVWESDLPRELAEDAELRTQPSMDAPLVGTTIPAGTEVDSALALEDLDESMGWIAMQTDGTTGWAPHWVVDPNLAGWGLPGDDGIEYPPGSVLPDGSIKTAEPIEPAEDTVTETAEPEPVETEPETAGSEQVTEDVAVDTEPAEPADDSGIPWLPVALGGGGALLLAGALLGRALGRKTEED